MRSLPSSSKLALAFTCPASAVLPAVERTSEAASTGTDKHDWLRNLRSMPVVSATERAPEAIRAWCESVNLDQILPYLGEGWFAEVALAYDVDTETTRFIGYDIGRAYGERLTPTEVFVTIDSASWGDETASAVDWKSGRMAVTGPRDNWQLRLGVLAVARWKGLVRGMAAVAKVPEDGEPYVEVAHFDEGDLMMFASELRELYRRLQGEVVPNIGSHCQYCPAWDSCPGQGRLIARMAARPEALEQDVVALLTPETAARAYHRLRAIEEVKKRMWRALYAYAEQTPINLGNGEAFGPVAVRREELDAGVTRATLEAMHGREVAEAACDFETSKAAVERALRPVYEARKKAGEKMTLKALNEEALGAIRAAGGVETKTKVDVRAHRAALPAGRDVGEEG